jgi:ERCC4-related helicase
MSTLKPYQEKIISLLIRQELLVAELYRFFAGLYPDLREFWNDMAKQEMEHATWIEYLSNKARNGEVIFKEEKIRTYTVESFLKYLEENLAKVKERAPTPKAAFSLALSMENSLLLKRIYYHFQCANPELSAVLTGLRVKLEDHRKRIEVQAAPFNSPPSGPCR